MIPPAPAHSAIAIAFALLAVACGWLATGAGARDVRLWRLASIALAALAIDQGFGVLEQLTAAARASAVEGGWYDNRRLFQREADEEQHAGRLRAALARRAGAARHRRRRARRGHGDEQPAPPAAVIRCRPAPYNGLTSLPHAAARRPP